ncbi:DUF6660 family protein [Spirosoma migulaei]
MKAIVCLFSFWLLLLTGLPCPDADCHAQSDQTASTSTSHSTDDHGHKAPCSPFCHCTICLGFSIPRSFSYMLTLAPNATTPDEQAFVYQSPSHSDVALAIWQPPKV